MTYLELHDMRFHPDVTNKVHVAIASVAFDILQPEVGATADRTTWAKEAIKNPATKMPELLHYVLIKNVGLTPAQILGASDAGYKTNIAEAVTKIVGPTA